MSYIMINTKRTRYFFQKLTEDICPGHDLKAKANEIIYISEDILKTLFRERKKMLKVNDS